MLERATTTEIKKVNRKNIFDLIYKEKKISKQDIALKLQLSLPTVAQNLKELESLNLIKKDGSFESTGGRKANAIVLISDAKIAIGLEIAKKRFQILALDLYGTIVKSIQYETPFENSEKYFETVGDYTNQFIKNLRISSKRILGVGIALQGLISSDGKTVTYGKILGCDCLKVTSFSKFIPFPCTMIHDAEAAASAELWHCSSISDAIYFHMGNNLGGAVIIDGELHKGRELKSGVIEHMVIIPDGKPCYCGKKGCLEVYCSIESLLDPQEGLPVFFDKLHHNDVSALARWDNYLGHLALAIDNLHMVIDCDTILGGELVSYLSPEDILKLKNLVSSETAFPFENNFIKVSSCNTMPIASGAALVFIKAFLNSVTDI
ncbi:MAG TPA: ROK family transcriptional regulator [Ruminiclostridium sp.]|nr:ROK family transcriptional regulator [Ruminiclostridium sp.]